MKNKDINEKKITIEGELRVKELLEERGISMQDFASQIGIVRETLTRTLKGNPRYDTLKAIADGLNLTVPELFSRNYKDKILMLKKPVLHGYIEIGNDIYAVHNRLEYLELIKKIDGIVHLDFFISEEEHKKAIRDFLSTSVLQGKSDAIMARYGILEVFTLSYDSTAERLSLTLCVRNGEIRFRTFDIKDYKAGNEFTRLEMIGLMEAILTEIEKIDEDGIE